MAVLETVELIELRVIDEPLEALRGRKSGVRIEPGELGEVLRHLWDEDGMGVCKDGGRSERGDSNSDSGQQDEGAAGGHVRHGTKGLVAADSAVPNYRIKDVSLNFPQRVPLVPGTFFPGERSCVSNAAGRKTTQPRGGIIGQGTCSGYR